MSTLRQEIIPFIDGNGLVAPGPIPFPSSEYGSIFAVIASNREECEQIMLDYHEDHYDFQEHLPNIKAAVQRAQEFKLADEPKSEIVGSLET